VELGKQLAKVIHADLQGDVKTVFFKQFITNLTLIVGVLSCTLQRGAG